jgi:hypothetical protein
LVLPVEKLDYHHEQTKRIHLNRTFGGDRYYCAIDGNTDAGTTAGKETGKGSCL